MQHTLTIVMAFQDVAIMVDRATNKSRGFGFVTFETEEAVEAVMRNKVSRFPSIPLLPLPPVSMSLVAYITEHSINSNFASAK